MQIDAVTLFPEMFDSIARFGVSQRALDWASGGFRPGILAISRMTTIAG